MSLWQRLKHVIVHRILGVADTPHRIAWGVLLGFVIGWTPTIGLQIVLYVATATLLRANKISGVPVLFISNPFTAVPLYWFAWKVGRFVLHGGGTGESATFAAVRAVLETPELSFWEGVLSAEFWSAITDMLIAMGLDLWVGCLLMGFATGIPGYFLTRWGVQAYRRARGSDVEPTPS